ncbi:hypothetical protein [Streptomyces sp. NPDC059262]|uniref:hypothetical protein n=1 Tax=Streptomyces sp. NPDC059262 TaxID=3346797 RepID=UPI0036C3B929
MREINWSDQSAGLVADRLGGSVRSRSTALSVPGTDAGAAVALTQKLVRLRTVRLGAGPSSSPVTGASSLRCPSVTRISRGAPSSAPPGRSAARQCDGCWTAVDGRYEPAL